MYEEIIKNLKIAQEAGAVLPCPRCGRLTMKESLYTNAISRRADVYVCDNCGRIEAVEDFASNGKADNDSLLSKWFIVRNVFGKIYAKQDRYGKYSVACNISMKISNEDIDDIMCAALEGGICYWCSKAEVIEDEYFGEYAHEQISKGGSLNLYDCETNEVYVLTKEKFLNGIKLAFEQGYADWLNSDYSIDTCKIDSEDADIIIQLALFEDVVFG